jgi:hypothetical protein
MCDFICRKYPGKFIDRESKLDIDGGWVGERWGMTAY